MFSHIQSSTTLTYGVGDNWQIGVNLFDVTLQKPHGNHHFIELSSDHPEENPCLLINIQKGIHIVDMLDIAIGTQTGAGYARKPSDLRVASFSYLNNQINIGIDVKISAGGYYTTQAYAGEGSNIGYMVGVQLPVISEKLYLEAEYISGTNQYSNFTAGLGFNIGKHWQLLSGIQVPSPGSNNSYGATFHFSRQ